jgi:hypothetical protein
MIDAAARAPGAIALDEGLAHALRLIARTRPDRTGWIAQPRALTLNTLVTLRSLGMIETLTPFAKPGSGGPTALIRVTPEGLRALMAGPGLAA